MNFSLRDGTVAKPCSFGYSLNFLSIVVCLRRRPRYAITPFSSWLETPFRYTYSQGQASLPTRCKATGPTAILDETLTNNSHYSCLAVDPILRIAGAISLWSVEIIIQLRIYVLYRCSRKASTIYLAKGIIQLISTCAGCRI